LTGFRADFRDGYPGINAATLLDVEGSPASLKLKDEVVPVLRFAVEERIRRGNPDYWDYATLLELEVLANDERAAMDALIQALGRVREKWEPETTTKNLTYIYNARNERGAANPWLTTIIDELVKASQPKS